MRPIGLPTGWGAYVCHRTDRLQALGYFPCFRDRTSSSTKENTMNWNVIKGDWMQFRGLVKERWGKLTDHNLDTIAGERDQLAERLQETYGMHKDQAELQVKAFEARHKDYQPITAA
jgi:uncharacterized protein YjbJ (UPF0337 family)